MSVDYKEFKEKEVREYKLESFFEGLPISVREIVAPDSNRLVIYAHGSFDEMDGHYGYYTRLFNQMADENIASFVQLNTARRPCYWNGSYKDVIDAFRGKTILEEYTDVYKVIKESLKRLQNLVSDPQKAEITLLGLSLGGTIMTLNAYQFPQVSKLMVLSSGCRTQNKGLPMMDTYPEAEIIKNAASDFKGEVVHVSAKHDQVVPNKFQDELYSSFPIGHKRREIIEDTDHIYSGKKDHLSEKIMDFITRKLI